MSCRNGWNRTQTRCLRICKIPVARSGAAHIPYTYWSIGRTDREVYLAAEKEGRLQDLPSNHSPEFLPPLQPTLRTGTEALTAAALAWLSRT